MDAGANWAPGPKPRLLRIDVRTNLVIPVTAGAEAEVQARREALGRLLQGLS